MSAPQPLSNSRVADALDRVSDLYDAQNGDAFRVRAYRAAASTLRQLDTDVADLWRREGLPGLLELPNVGPGIARAIEQLVRTGRLMLLERLQGELGPERAFASVPGIGKALAHRIHDRLHISSLEELEVAAHDGQAWAAWCDGHAADRLAEYLDSFSSRRHRSIA